MIKQAADKLFLKYVFVFTLLLTCLFTGSVQASSEIDVGLIVSQFSAEVIAPSAFVATEPDGNQTTLEKGKYFIAANSSKIMLGSHQLASGTVLEMAEPKDKEEKTRNRKTKRKKQTKTQLLILIKFLAKLQTKSKTGIKNKIKTRLPLTLPAICLL